MPRLGEERLPHLLTNLALPHAPEQALGADETVQPPHARDTALMTVARVGISTAIVRRKGAMARTCTVAWWGEGCARCPQSADQHDEVSRALESASQRVSGVPKPTGLTRLSAEQRLVILGLLLVSTSVLSPGHRTLPEVVRAQSSGVGANDVEVSCSIRHSRSARLGLYSR